APVAAPAAAVNAAALQAELAAADKSNAEIRALLRHYGVREELGRPRERIVKWAVRLEAAAAGAKDAEATLAAFAPADVRRHIFLLEGILKLYVERYGKKV